MSLRRIRESGWRARGLTALACACTAACAGTAADGVILVAAASDLAAAMPSLATAFELETGTTVDVTLGSSGRLARQIVQGAPVDVFLSADAHQVDELASAGRVEPGSRGVYAYGRLVLLAGRVVEPPSDVASLADPAYARIAVANPEHAPYGRAAVEAFEGAGVRDLVSARLVPVENVRQTVQLAETGAVDAALSALALVDSARHRWIVVPATLHEPLAQTAVVIAGSPRRDAANAFVAFIRGPRGREILARYGFELP